ncbi:nicotinate phosphoribosyltransferase [Candidatus Geothermarchaeota archaeon]|nr:MAG: nicotinate phosphoribosyltransferase [Candidatus Geothermarchaeota archaeon]
MVEFYIADSNDIKKGRTTDIYFMRTVEVLKKDGKDKVHVDMEITTNKLPYGFSWGILAGVNEVIALLKDHKLDLYIMREGTLFKPRDDYGVRMPIGIISGPYGEFAIYETPLLGLLCQASGVATYSAHIRFNASDKVLLSFGARRMHPAITPLIDYAAYIAGFDGISAVISAEKLGVKPTGTMPHALIIIYGDQKKAWKAFDKYVNEDVPRIALIDTFSDEKTEALLAAEALGSRLYGVRLDTPGSRRGDIGEVIREVRWELDIRGYKNVKIFLSGGVDLDEVKRLRDAPVDGFGIGTSVSNARTIDFALDIVAKEGKPIAKRGKYSGIKNVYRCPRCYSFKVVTWDKATDKKIKCDKCGSDMERLLIKVIEDGKIIIKPPKPSETREYVLKQLEDIRRLGWSD